MTTVNTIEDLIRILDERPEWNEALRSRLLSRDLLELPQAFAEFAKGAERRLVTLETSLVTLETSLATLETSLAALQDTLAKYIENTDQRLMALEAGQNRLVSDVAPLKAAHARNGALRMVARIARVVGCREYRVLDLGDLLNMIDDADTTGIPSNELTSFENADIIIEATHRDNGENHYIAVEASYTGSWRDVDRATRNAGYLTRFTGQPAHAVVAAQRIRPGIERMVERGEVHWAQILQKELETE
jgi:hypothetical protein